MTLGYNIYYCTAEGVGFEPTRHFCPPVFKTGSIGRSDSPPGSSEDEHRLILTDGRGSD